MISIRPRIKRLSAALTALMLLLSAAAAAAQAPAAAGQTSGEEAQPERKGSAWTLTWPLGFHEPSVIDTLTYNYQRQAIPSMVSDAFATTGNLGAEGQTQIFFGRRPFGAFFFENALDAWRTDFTQQKFYNVYTPMTLLSYNLGGGRHTNQDRLRATFAGNVNRRIGIGASLDYLYSKGSYDCQAVKDFSFGFEGYYTGDRYEMQAFYNHFNMVNKENGGITDDLYITDPAAVQGGVSKIDYKTIPTRLSAAHSRVNGDEFYMGHALKFGFWREEQVNDTLRRDVYVPVTKILYTFDYRSGHHVFRNTDASEGADFWQNCYLNAGETNDNTRYRRISNSFGVALLEGFQKWARFGLDAFITYDLFKYTQTTADDGVPGGDQTETGLTPLPEGFAIEPKATRGHLWVGGRLSRTQGTLLRYSADARFGLAGDVAGDLDINGDISTRFRMLGDTVEIKASGFFRNSAQPYLLQHYISNHFAWDNDFGKTRSFRIGGELTIPWTRTVISAGVENLQNYVYFDRSSLPRQYGGSIQIFAARLDQRLRFGIWNWDNRITYQTSSDKEILPLPALSVYSNMYLRFIAFRVLDMQIGVDCDYYTRYKGPSYQPATMTFHLQDEIDTGNFAFCNAYITARLYKVRFYVMYSHFNQGWFSKGFFSMPHYPVNPRRLLLGVSVDFSN